MFGLPAVSLRAAVIAAVLFGLGACVADRDQFPPACPRVAFLTPTADLSVYRPGSGGRDLTQLMVAGRMQGINGECHPGGNKATVRATVSVSAVLARGPAMPGNVANVPVFIAVTDGDQILDKRIYTLKAEFPSNVDRVTVSSPEVSLALPVSATKSAAAYSILAGFQLTPDQLAANRAAQRR